MKLILAHDDGEVIDTLVGVSGPEFDGCRRNALAAQLLLAQFHINDRHKIKEIAVRGGLTPAPE